jgi:hypothetical protein
MGRAGKLIKEMQPNVIVIYLSRLPSQGRETADALRSMKATESIPIIFVDGAENKVQKMKEKIPDAIFSSSNELKEVIMKIQS